MTGQPKTQTVYDDNAQDAADARLVPDATGRIRSQDLLRQQREIEIDHEGRIYRLRLTQHNKLILTA